MKNRAILVDCGVIVKHLSIDGRLPFYRMAVPCQPSVKWIEDENILKSIKPLKVFDFEYKFTEDDVDVYVCRTKLIPYFYVRTFDNKAADAIKIDFNATEVVETILSSKIKWFRKLAANKDLTEDEIAMAISVMTEEIVEAIAVRH